MRTVFLASTALLAMPTIAQSATFSAATGGFLMIQGDIAVGDAQRFGAAMIDATRGGNTIRLVFLDSPGGDIEAAIKIGELVGIAHVGTALLPNATCASACVLVLASGTKVGISPGSRVGVHQGRDKAGNVAWGASYGMAAYLAQHHVAHDVTTALIDKAGNDVTWMTADQMRASGWTMLPPEGQRPSGPKPPAPVSTSWHALIGQPFSMGGHGEDGKGLTGTIAAAKLVTTNPAGKLYRLDGTTSWAFCSTSHPAVANKDGDGFYALRINLGPHRSIASANAWAYSTYLAACHGGIAWTDDSAIGRLGYRDTPASAARINKPEVLAPIDQLAVTEAAMAEHRPRLLGR